MLSLLFPAMLMTLGLTLAQEAPKCNPAIVGDLDKYYPEGIPQNIVGQLHATGPYSFVSLSLPNALTLTGDCATCVGFRVSDDKKSVKLTRKMSQGAVSTVFGIAGEEDGVISYLGATDVVPKYKIYHLFFKDGVAVTYRCCDECNGSDLNVGIAVADRLANTAETQLALVEAKQFVHKYNLDVNLTKLKLCSA
ncbi:hypothetical protein J6590_029355 [Homalodisca vitripennis]|nr:hypothetical protein J6590_029355 [Homalodisca vitripennis]